MSWAPGWDSAFPAPQARPPFPAPLRLHPVLSCRLCRPVRSSRRQPHGLSPGQNSVLARLCVPSTCLNSLCLHSGGHLHLRSGPPWGGSRGPAVLRLDVLGVLMLTWRRPSNFLCVPRRSALSFPAAHRRGNETRLGPWLRAAVPVWHVPRAVAGLRGSRRPHTGPTISAPAGAELVSVQGGVRAPGDISLPPWFVTARLVCKTPRFRWFLYFMAGR